MQRYNGFTETEDNTSGNIFVTGVSAASSGDLDYATIAYSSSGIALWTNRYNGPVNRDDQAVAVAVDGNGNVFVAGSSARSTNLFKSVYATVKYSNTGVPLWTRRYEQPGNNQDSAVAVVVDSNGNAFVTGTSYGMGGFYDYLTIKYSSEGVPLWTNRYDNGWGTLEDQATAIAVDVSGNAVVTGYSYGIGASYDYATIKYSSDGNPVWTNRFDGLYYDVANAVAVDNDGNVFVTGSSWWSPTNVSYLTVAYSGGGMELWAATYGGPLGKDAASTVIVDGGGNVYVTGTSVRADFPYSSDYATIKYSGTGVALWTNRYEGLGKGDNSATALAVDGSGNLLVTGYSNKNGSDWDDYATIKYTSTGVALWTNRFNGTGTEPARANAVAVDNVGNVFVTGYSVGGGGHTEFATIAYSSDGLPLWTNRYSAPANSYDEAKAVAVDLSGNVVVTGISAGDYATIAYSNAGVPLWTNRYNGPVGGFDAPWGNQSLALGPGGVAYVTGASTGYPASGTDFATVKYLISPPPELRIERVATDAIRISWPTNATNYVLEFKEQLSTNFFWAPVTTPVGIEGSRLCTTNTTDSGNARYYRLRS